MQHDTKPRSHAPALFAGFVGLGLAGTSLAHNIEGLWPQITALPGTFEYFNQMMMAGGSTVGLNVIALMGFTYATLMAKQASWGKSAGLVGVAILAMLWSGTTQLGVIAEKTFAVSGSKEQALDQYRRALKAEQQLIAAKPMSYKFLGTAQADLQTAIAALKSHRYGSKTAWETTSQCTGDITAKASRKLCEGYAIAVLALEESKAAADIDQRLAAVNKVIAKGPPTMIDGGPEMVTAATGGLLSVKTVQIILVFMRSFGIDISAGLMMAAAVSLWPYKTSPASVFNGGGGSSRQNTQRVIKNLVSSVHPDHSRVLNSLNTLSDRDGNFKTSYRALSARSGVATGAMNEALACLEAAGFIERYSSKGKGTTGRLLPVDSLDGASDAQTLVTA